MLFGFPSQQARNQLIIQVEVNLASPGELGPDFEDTHMPLLTENLALTPATHITSYSGLVLMATLSRQCMQHVMQSTAAESDSPPFRSGFWDHHYALSQAINDRMTVLQAHLSTKASRADPAAFSLLVNLCALDLYLHEAAIAQADRQDLTPSVVAESRRRCSVNALKIASTIRISYPVSRRDGDILALQRTFIGWPLVMSMRALWRELPTATDLTADGVAGSLRFLSDVLDAIEEKNGYWHHLVAGVGVTLQKWEEEHDGFGSLLR